MGTEALIVYAPAAVVILVVALRFRTLRILRSRGIPVSGTVVKHVVRDTGADKFWVEFIAQDGSQVTRRLLAPEPEKAVRLVYDPERLSRSLRADQVDGREYSVLLWMWFAGACFWALIMRFAI